jgi:hypothetical protein
MGRLCVNAKTRDHGLKLVILLAFVGSAGRDIQYP